MDFPVRTEDKNRVYFTSPLIALVFAERIENIGKWAVSMPLVGRAGWVVIWEPK